MSDYQAHRDMMVKVRDWFVRIGLSANEYQISAVATIIRNRENQIIFDMKREKDIQTIHNATAEEKPKVIGFDDAVSKKRSKSGKKLITCPWCSGTTVPLIPGGRVTQDGACGECNKDGMVAVWTTDDVPGNAGL